MTITEEILLSLVPGSAASRRRLSLLYPNPPESIDWEELLLRASQLQLIPLLRYNLARTGCHVPAGIALRLDEEGRLWAARHLSTVSETVKLAELLQPAGIIAIPLKGAALMAGGYYAEPGLRTFSDIDLLVDPTRIEDAHRLLVESGCQPLPGQRDVRPRQRLANEQNHLWPLRSPDGSIVELHHRAFHMAARETDLDFHHISAGAVSKKTDSGHSVLLPASHDLAFHLVHHTMIDLQSTHLSLRTLADLHAIFQRHPESKAELLRLAGSFGYYPVVKSTLDLSDLLAGGSIADLKAAETDDVLGLMIETMLSKDTEALAETARIFEYLDLSRHPLKKIGNLLALIFTTGEHLDQLYGPPKSGLKPLRYLMRPLDLIRRFPWRGLSPFALIRYRKMRMLNGIHSR